jgi:hypothetical protein
MACARCQRSSHLVVLILPSERIEQMPSVGVQPKPLGIGAWSFRPRGQTLNGCVLGQPRASASHGPANVPQTPICPAMANICESCSAGRAQTPSWLHPSRRESRAMLNIMGATQELRQIRAFDKTCRLHARRCRDPGSNGGPSDLRSDALPTELSRLMLLDEHMGPMSD